MEGESPSDADLLRAYVDGDGDAFAVLYDRYDSQCYGYIRRTLGSAHADAAEDLHQETWVAVATKGHTYDAQGASFVTWMYTIARHKVLDHFRKQKVAFLVTHDDDAVNAQMDGAPTPAEAVQSRELALALVSAVDSLPLAQRETFVLFAGGELTLGEIAAATQVGIETTKSRLRYARAALRSLLSHWRGGDA